MIIKIARTKRKINFKNLTGKELACFGFVNQYLNYFLLAMFTVNDCFRLVIWHFAANYWHLLKGILPVKDVYFLQQLSRGDCDNLRC